MTKLEHSLVIVLSDMAAELWRAAYADSHKDGTRSQAVIYAVGMSQLICRVTNLQPERHAPAITAFITGMVTQDEMTAGMDTPR